MLGTAPPPSAPPTRTRRLHSLKLYPDDGSQTPKKPVVKEKYEEFGLAPENLSRALEDASTVVSPLIPWTTCGAFLTATLGVPTLLYAPFAFFSLTNLMLALACALLGRNILRDIDARSLPTAGKRHSEQPDHA